MTAEFFDGPCDGMKLELPEPLPPSAIIPIRYADGSVRVQSYTLFGEFLNQAHYYWEHSPKPA